MIQTVTYQHIINELNQIPVDFLLDVYNMLHSFKNKIDDRSTNRLNVLQFAGSWNDMSDDDFSDYKSEIERSKNEMFNRIIDL
jgi:hypothetical protein